MKAQIPSEGGVEQGRGARLTPDLGGRGGFVGRERELEQIAGALRATLAGRGGVVLLAGDAGIGKTRTAEELAAWARSHGAAVHWGRCHEGAGAPAYWPWVQVLRSCLAGRSTARHLAAPVAQLIPELRARSTPPKNAAAAEPERARFELFDGVSSFLRAGAATQPLVLVLDDAHWADTPSLLLLQFLARELTEVPVLLVVTYRDVEIESGHPLASVVAELCRGRGFLRLALRGLGSEAVRDLAASLCGETVSPSFAEALLRRTEGNPFFVGELVRHCVEEGVSVAGSGSSLYTAAVPEGVNAVIRRRLARLSPHCNRILAVAAVIGRDFDAAILRLVLEGHDSSISGDVDTALRHAQEARVLGSVRASGDRHRFAHALVRETLYEAQPVDQRAQLHRQIGLVLEELHAGPKAPLAELAYHFVEAGRAGHGWRKAIDYSLLAARQAGEALAYEEAVVHFERGLEALEGLGDAGVERERAEALLALGEELIHAGEPQRAKETFLRAAAAARSVGAPEHLARAALGYETVASDLGGSEPDRAYVNLLEEAAAALGPSASRHRALVLARLAQVPHRSMPRERRGALSKEAVEIARGLRDPYALAVALRGRNYALWDSEPPEARRLRADEVVQWAEEAGDRAIALDGRMQRAFAFLEMGDRAALDREVHAYRILSDELRQPRYLWHCLILRTVVAALSGEFVAAEQLAAEGLSMGQRCNQSNALQVYSLQLFAMRRETGGLDAVEMSVRLLAEQHPIAAWHCALAFLYSELGRETEARQEFERLAARDFNDIPIDPLWLISIATLAEACTFLGDADRAGRLYELLLPYGPRTVVVGGAVCLGSVRRPLGMLARTMGRLDEAIADLEEAVRFDAAMGAAPALAHSQCQLARTLRLRGEASDVTRAGALEEAARDTAQRLGLLRLTEALRTAPVAVPVEIENRGSVAVFRREGEYWTIAYGGQTVRLRDAKGLHYLALLVRHPRQEFHVADLVAAARISPLADTGAVLDDAAKSAYRLRLGELRDELAEAERFNDLGRIPSLREEMSAIADHLQSALGAGGRSRRSGSYAERARLTVTQCIKASLRKMRISHPILGQHLAISVKTGYFCSYDPHPGGPSDWLL